MEQLSLYDTTCVTGAYSLYSGKVPKGEDKKEISNYVAELTLGKLEQRLHGATMTTKKTHRSYVLIVKDNHMSSNEELKIRIKLSLIKNQIIANSHVRFDKLNVLAGTLYQSMKEYFQSMGFGGTTVLRNPH